jgi:hypothetical protein
MVNKRRKQRRRTGTINLMQLKKDLELKQEGECVGDRAVLLRLDSFTSACRSPADLPPRPVAVRLGGLATKSDPFPSLAFTRSSREVNKQLGSWSRVEWEANLSLAPDYGLRPQVKCEGHGPKHRQRSGASPEQSEERASCGS